MGSSNDATRYRARYRDPLGRQLSETFSRSSTRSVLTRGASRHRARPLARSKRRTAHAAIVVGEFLSLARRLSPTTQQTYRRDLDKYILPALAPTGSAGSPRTK